MKIENGQATDLKIAYIGGGSRGWAWRLMADLAAEKMLAGTINLYDIDFEAAKKNETIGNRLSARVDVAGQWEYKAIPSLEEALKGADFIIISIMPGTFDEMDSDVHYPEKYDIWQPVGDTAGPGGLVRSLRTIPMYVTIANAIKDFAPNAWVINYTNPMSMCIRVLYDVFPEIKAFGCCHEVFGTQTLLKDIYQEKSGSDKLTREDIDVNVIGINHFTWFTSASTGGIDLFPVFGEYADKHYEEGFTKGDQSWLNKSFKSGHRVKFDLFKRYGYIAAAGDRHLVEFLPSNFYLSSPEKVNEWMYQLTTVNKRKSDLADRLSKSSKLVLGEEEVDLSPSGEEGVQLIKALCGLGRFYSNVNIPNSNLQISNLPKSAVVETNAVFEKDCIRPVFAGGVPDNVLELMMPHAENQDYILESGLHYNFDMALKALINDPNTKSKINEKQAEQMLKGMIANTIKYLPSSWEKYII
ncbi:MAG: alpha-glucosidase/alpha-galactosidase [Lachnospiraceae bacterium]